MRLVVDNRKARYDYHIDEVLEAGLVLTGTEVKSVRAGRVQLRDSFALVRDGEVYLYNAHIAPYEQGHQLNHDPYRPRKLLLHRREIDWLAGRVRQKGYTIVPLRLYFNDRGIAKVELGLARGKKQYDKRRAVAEREAKRQIDRALKARSQRPKFGGE
jgi:SsrA-binding protein